MSFVSKLQLSMKMYQKHEFIKVLCNETLFLQFLDFVKVWLASLYGFVTDIYGFVTDIYGFVTDTYVWTCLDICITLTLTLISITLTLTLISITLTLITLTLQRWTCPTCIALTLTLTLHVRHVWSQLTNNPSSMTLKAKTCFFSLKVQKLFWI